MDAELVGQGAEVRTRPSRRSTAIAALGPLTALGGLAWALFQPYRIIFLDADGSGFWQLAVQPPLLVILAGAVFHFLVAPGVLADLEQSKEEAP